MKKIFIFMLAICMALVLFSCQSATKNLGGTTTIELPAGEKLETITWKDDSLWYLTRPMTENDIPETHTFQQSSNFGILEGTVVIIESAEETE